MTSKGQLRRYTTERLLKRRENIIYDGKLAKQRKQDLEERRVSNFVEISRQGLTRKAQSKFNHCQRELKRIDEVLTEREISPPKEDLT